MIITLDKETKSKADLKKVGQWVYSEDASTDYICMCWVVDDAKHILEWTPEAYVEDLKDLFYLLECPEVIIEAHNYAFEYSMWYNVGFKRYGFPDPSRFNWRDSMAAASYYALPPALDKLARALGMGAKDPEGERLISKYSKLHLKTAKEIIPPEDLIKFIKYCKKDVELERAISNYLGDLPSDELEVFNLDRVINLRGINLDEAGINVASHIVQQRAAELTSRFRSITGINPTQRDKYLVWLKDRGLTLPNLKAETVDEFLEEEEASPTPWILPEILETIKLRKRVNKASTKKLDAMMRQRGSDGRARFQTRYHGAGTGRSTGAGFQPLNMVRSYESDVVPPEQLVRDVMHGDCRFLDMMYGDAMLAVSKASRHWIVPKKGHRILAGDYVSVEAIMLACLAGEEWKIEAFRNRVPMYELTADKIFKLPPGTVTKKTHPDERQDGKTGELAFGYQGGLGAWRNFDSSDRHSDDEVHKIKDAWRLENPMIVKSWSDAHWAAIKAVENPGKEYEINQYLSFQTIDEWLTMRLPDGKRLWYYDPQLRMKMPSWHKPLTDEKCAAGTCRCEPRLSVSYMAWKEGRWKRVYSYGGKWMENATQAVSRQFLTPAMLRIEKAGYPIILTVYDEIVSEPKIGFGSKKEYQDLLEERPLWCRDWPIRADVWEGLHYKK